MKFKVVFFLLGRLLCIIGALMLVPAVVASYYHESAIVGSFVKPALMTVFAGVILTLIFRGAKDAGLGTREGFLIVTLGWFAVSLIGAAPFWIGGVFPSVVDAVFESTSGFTTTGASVLREIEALPRGMLFWRSFTQWLGGMGIIVLAVAILPQLSIGGMQLLRKELPGPTFEQLKPRIKQTALSLWKIYVLFSVFLGLLLYFFGMPFFDSICHVFSTMSTGGFSPRSGSISAYSSVLQFIITLFMFLAGANFVLHYSWLRGDFKKVAKDPEFRFFLFLLLLGFTLVAGALFWQAGRPLAAAARHALFQVVSLATSTGFVTDDFDAWPYLSKGMLFLLMFVGGCAGSTGGGLKQIRLLLLFKQARQSIVQHIFPKAVVPVKLEKRVVSEDVLHGVSSFFLLYLVIFSLCTLALLVCNIDFVTATSAVVACLSNTGPGFNLVGASQNYAFLPDLIKVLLSLCMIVGRLELFTVLVLFFPAAWRS